MTNRRTIKFRAWDGKAFINADAYIKQDGSAYSYEKDYGGTFSSNERLEPKQCVIQMFTGFLDKNGKEIYEGDNVNASGGRYDKDIADVSGFTDMCVEGTVVFYKGCFMIGNYTLLDYTEFKVIGNIFES